ncbi:hypothetical protein Taro_013104 [Colocasia esculenta]|uniref:Peroxidase n=1 Tax=Colocasia esculenta TaxID=4460 RepID=A0A843UAQ7_COLES|nr:hypothetical protein [Colocasia esculenta]
MEVGRGLCVVVVLLVTAMGQGDAQLRQGFYGLTCPLVEGIVRQTVATKISQTFTTVPATLRLFFHDCFVEGCDASVLIASPNGDAEKDADDNLSLAGDGFDTVIKAKTAVEAACPGVVSCADILAIAARDVVVLSGGPVFPVELGRRDGHVSQKLRVAGNLPLPNFTLDELNSMFQRNNLSQTDMVALSGAHTVGFSHCNRFSSRIYSNPPDPTVDPAYAQQLRSSCPSNVDPSVAVNMDPTTPNVFDNAYYSNLVARKGMFTSDEVLFSSSQSRGTVVDFANNPADFATAFAAAMVKLGRTGVKTGEQGEIRRDCAAFN